MNNSGHYEVLRSLLREAGQAHHQAFLDVDGYEPDWLDWYAAWLHLSVSGLLENRFTQLEYGSLLLEVSVEQSALSPEADWPTYYAHWFVGEFS